MDLPNGIVPIGDLDFYGGSGAVPEGDYSVFHEFMIFAGTKKDGSSAGPPRLGVMLTLHDLNDPEYRGDKARQKHMSLGTDAHKLYMPDPDTGGKTLLVRENASATKLNDKTNWFQYLRSLYDASLERGIFVGDLTVLDGVHVHIKNIPEPDDRKNFTSAAALTGDAAPAPEKRGSQVIPVVETIIAAPWRGEDCGIPDEAPAAKSTAKAKPAAAKPAASKPNGAVKAPAKAAAVADDEDDVLTAAQVAVAGVMENNAKGCAQVILRTQVFKSVSKAQGPETATKVIDTYFENGIPALNGLLNTLEWQTDGSKITAVA